MNFKIFLQLFSLFIFFFNLSCQHNQTQKVFYQSINQEIINQNKDNQSLSQNHNQIDLSLSTLEEQIIDKEKAAKKLQQARDERIEIEIKNPNNNQIEVNVARFARETNNKVGENVFSRNGFSIYNHWNECAKFKNKDEAQRKFLKTGGPYTDKFNLDPDGDGFACKWDPKAYRKLTIPND